MNRVERDDSELPKDQAKIPGLRERHGAKRIIGRIETNRISIETNSDVEKVRVDNEKAAYMRRKRLIQVIVSGMNVRPQRIEDHTKRHANLSREVKIRIIRKLYTMKAPELPERLHELIDELEELDDDDISLLHLACSY